MNKTGTSWNKGKKQTWISKKNKSKFILIEDLDYYLLQGWIKGRHNIRGKPLHISTKNKLSKAFKGKTYEEIYGDKAQLMRDKRSQERKGKTFSTRARAMEEKYEIIPDQKYRTT